MPVVIHFGNDIIERQVIPCGVSQVSPAFPIADGSVMMPIQLDPNGSQFVHPSGGQIPADALPTPTSSVDSTSYTMVWNGASWDRAESITISPFGDLTTAPLKGTISTASFSLLYNQNAGKYQSPVCGYLNSDSAPPAVVGAVTAAYEFEYNGTSWDRKRVTNVFKTVTITAAGSTAVWTPAAGKKFRLMKVSMHLTSNATLAAAGLLLAQLLDSAAVIGVNNTWYVPAVLTSLNHPNFVFDLGNGYLSSAANNILNLNLSVALTSGLISITVSGTEE